MVKEEEEEAAAGMESQIELALASRIQHFKDNADSLTLGTVRRLLEKDIGLEAYALDAHKKFIKALVEKLLEDSNDASVDSGTKVEMPKIDDARKGLSEIATEDDPKMEDSPVMGLMTTKSDLVDTGTTEQKIRKAVWDRASHIRDNSETITMISLRRLLEEDMALPTCSLDPFKSFIRSQIDEILEPSKVSKPTPITKKAKTPSLKNISETKSSSTHDKIKSRKREVGSGGNNDKPHAVNKRKEPQKETKIPNKKQKKPGKSPSDEGADNMDVDSDLHSESSDGKNVKAKQVSTPAYGKRVENLKSIIKACGLGIAPSVYKRAKQVSDEEREAFVIKELKGILSREGLSANPTEKEIKEVKRRKDKEKELEGIDLSNIVTSSLTVDIHKHFMPPARVPKPKLHVERRI
ncbi:hypothetical protein Leryth_023066 [Lithospermum erythrorhizon]|nr:hypothetical protein Leryth_023066 [Lithospermum erythrorhizon]